MLSNNMRLIMKYLFLPNHSAQCLRCFYFISTKNIFHNNHLKEPVSLKQSCIPSKNMASSAGLSLQTVYQILTNYAPLSLAQSWDNVGILIKPVTTKNISKVMLTIDLSEPVMQEALDEHVDMIISYHPPIFTAFKRITSKAWKERIIATCLENKIVVYSPHTSWDAVKGGLTDWLSSCFDCKSVVAMEPTKSLAATNSMEKYSFTIYCPQQYSSKLREMVQTNSENCQRILSSTEPGSNGMIRYELVCPMSEATYYMQEMERCGCIYNLQERNPVPEMDSGMGRFCKLQEPITLSEAVAKIKKHVGLPHLRLALAVGKTTDSMIQNIAFVAGSGGSLLRGYSADLYVTGEMLHHDVLDANHNDTSVILINHSDSERGFLQKVAPLLHQKFDSKVEVLISKTDKDPLVTV